jgi:predicted amidophosphoribosyltransferase
VFNFPHSTASGGAVCNSCKIMWHSELGCSCLACGRPLSSLSSDTLLCAWCGQAWDLELIQDAYALGDWESQIDWSTPKGANR